MISAITNLPTFRMTNTQNNRRQPQLRPLGYDTVSFTSNNLLAKSSDEITNSVLSAINNDENYIGKGTEGIVYKIPDTDYCVKVLHNKKSDFGKWDTSVSPKEKVNHVVAKAENKAVIMKHIEGEPLHWGKEPKEIYNLPAQSYKNLLKQLSDAHRNYMVFDNAMVNIIYNPSDKSLTAIDFYDEDIVQEKDFLPLSNVFSCLMRKGHTAEDNSTNRQFCGKLLNIVIDELDLNKRQEFYINKRDVVNTIEKLKWSQLKEAPKQLEFLETSMGNLIDIKQSLNKTEEMKNRFEWEKKYSKCIINQVLSD